MEENDGKNPQNHEAPTQKPSDHQESDPTEAKPAAAALDREEIFKALEIVERDSFAIAESYASLFCSLRLALSEVTSTSVDNMQCFGDTVGSIQEYALDAATKGNRYINSCLRLSEELKGMESLALQFEHMNAFDVKPVLKNVELDLVGVLKCIHFQRLMEILAGHKHLD